MCGPNAVPPLPQTQAPTYVSTNTEAMLRVLDPNNGLPCYSNAPKIVVPLPTGQALIEPSTLPSGQVNPKAGQMMRDRLGNPLGEKGIIFPNLIDDVWQAVPTNASRPKLSAAPTITDAATKKLEGWLTSKVSLSDLSQPRVTKQLVDLLIQTNAIVVEPGSSSVVIANEATPEQWSRVYKWISGRTRDGNGNPNDLTLADYQELLGFMRTELGLIDMYNSNAAFVSAEMVPAEGIPVPTDSSGAEIQAYGYKKRNDAQLKNIHYAFQLLGPHQFFAEGRGPQIGDEGLIVVFMHDDKRGVEKNGQKWLGRAIQPDVFLRTYVTTGKNKIDALERIPVVQGGVSIA